jgi:hypothetical protein
MKAECLLESIQTEYEGTQIHEVADDVAHRMMESVCLIM